MLHRRNFLSASGSALLVSLSGAAPAFLVRTAKGALETADGRRLVVIQLSGGNDGLNTVVPFGNDDYRKARPSLAIAANNVLKVNDEIGLHPALRGFSKMLDQGRLGIVQGVGYPNPNRSHFESMDIWHNCRPDNPSHSTGWLGRYLDRHSLPGDVPALHFGEEFQPLALASRNNHSISVRSIERFRLEVGESDAVERILKSLVDAPRDPSNELLSIIQATTQSALVTSARVNSAMREYTTSVKYPNSGLAQKLRSIAQLISSDVDAPIYYTALNGFDTHSTQADAHAGLLTELGDAMAAFVDDLHEHQNLDRVLIMVFSEFGRRVAENASQGTDHGAAAPMFLAGSKIRSGLHGRHPSLTDLDDGDLRFHTDFRQVYAEIVTNWLGQPAAEIVGGDFAPLRIIS